MLCLDTSAIVDYLEGHPHIGAFLEDHPSEPMFVPSPVLYEVFLGGARIHGSEGVTGLREDLEWLQPIAFSIDAAAETALVDSELRREGTPIGAINTLIAGTVRNVGGTLVTADADFELVEDLTTYSYR